MILREDESEVIVTALITVIASGLSDRPSQNKDDCNYISKTTQSVLLALYTFSPQFFIKCTVVQFHFLHLEINISVFCIPLCCIWLTFLFGR